MLTLFVLPLILAALVLSAVYSVPSEWRVVLYFLVFVGPSVLFTNAVLTVASALERALDSADRSVRWEPGRACGGLCCGRLRAMSVVTPLCRHSRISGRRGGLRK